MKIRFHSVITVLIHVLHKLYSKFPASAHAPSHLSSFSLFFSHLDKPKRFLASLFHQYLDELMYIYIYIYITAIPSLAHFIILVGICLCARKEVY